jgi:16S rRNA (guanine527-N7)-methyltransferase
MNDSGVIQPEALGELPRQVLGQAFDRVARFHDALLTEGEVRGLIGPSEGGRLWSRHLLNSAAVAGFLPADGGRVIDVGSGAGLPGLVVAALRPDLDVELIEPMERRTEWLREMVEAMGLTNVTISRGRAEEYEGAREADAVTARAVAPLGRLARWSAGLARSGGQLVALKGRGAAAELERDRKAVHKAGWRSPEIHQVVVAEGLEPTYVVTATLR